MQMRERKKTRDLKKTYSVSILLRVYLQELVKRKDIEMKDTGKTNKHRYDKQTKKIK